MFSRPWLEHKRPPGGTPLELSGLSEKAATPRVTLRATSAKETHLHVVHGKKRKISLDGGERRLVY